MEKTKKAIEENTMAMGFSKVTACFGVSFSSAGSETESPPMTKAPVGSATNAMPMLFI